MKEEHSKQQDENVVQGDNTGTACAPPAPGERDYYFAGRPLRLGREPVLLIDDYLVEDRWNLRRELNQPIKHPANPILTGDKPWDRKPSFPSVLWDAEQQCFHMWYEVFDWNAFVHQFRKKDWKPEHGYPYYVCYARSTDAINWEKPALGFLDYRGWKDTNVMLLGEQKAQAHRVIYNHDSTGQPGKFLLSYKDNIHGGKTKGAMCLMYSDDGINWTPDPANPVVRGLRDTKHNLLYDDRHERWLLYTRPCSFAAQHKMSEEDKPFGQRSRTAVAMGPAPQKLGFPRNVLWTEEDQPEKIDQNLVVKRGAHLLGFRLMMDEQSFTQTHLSFSYDGLHWRHLPGDPPFLPRGSGPESFDYGEAQPPKNIVEVDGKMYMYYSGDFTEQHEKRSLHSIGVAMLDADRFVAQRAGDEGGYLLTREFLIEGNALYLNMRPVTHKTQFSRVGVELVRVPPYASGSRPEPVEGYTFDDCDLAPHDLTRHCVTWGGQNLAPLRGTPVQARIYMRNLDLYSLEVADDDSS